MQHRSQARPGRVVGALLALFASASEAGFVVTGEGLPYSGLSSLSREEDRVLQQYYDESFFAGIAAPTTLTGMAFRLPAIADVDYPSLGDLDFGRYDITLARPSAAAAAADGLVSAIFADNMSDPVLVRSGALTIPQDSFESNAAGVDADFSFEIAFDTPYLFAPGQALVMLVRHDGHGDVHGVETRWNFDGYAWDNGTVLAVGDVDAALADFGPGAFDVANRIRFTYADPVAVPEPATVALLVVALGGLGIAFGGRRAPI